MQNDNNQIKKDENLNEFKDDLTEAIKIHEQIKGMGFDRILERLKDYGFADPEILAKKILENTPQAIKKNKN